MEPPTEPEELEELRPARRLGVVAVAFGVFLAAGAFAWSAFRPGGSASPPQQSLPAGYPDPPASGYWIVFPSSPLVTGSKTDPTLEVVARTNLPDGTLYSVDTTETGSCCPAVKDGQIILKERNGSCYGLVGAVGGSPGLSITITTSADTGIGMGFGLGVPSGAQQPEAPHQPDSVLHILGQHFENLEGDQVVEKDGQTQLVASTNYKWPEPQCGPDSLPLFGGPDCNPNDFENELQGHSIEEAMGQVMGTLTQARMCEFWAVELPPDVEAQHPWPEFAAQWREWFLNPPKDFSDAKSNSGWTNEPVTWHVTDQRGDRYFVDITDHGATIASLEVDSLPDFCPNCSKNVVPFWGVVGWTLNAASG